VVRGLILLIGVAGCDGVFDLDELSAPENVWGKPWNARQGDLGIPVGQGEDVSLTGDMLEMYFNQGTGTLVIRRDSVTANWGAPVVVAELGAATTPKVSPDGLELLLASNRRGYLLLAAAVRRRTVSRGELHSRAFVGLQRGRSVGLARRSSHLFRPRHRARRFADADKPVASRGALMNPCDHRTVAQDLGLDLDELRGARTPVLGARITREGEERVAMANLGGREARVERGVTRIR